MTKCQHPLSGYRTDTYVVLGSLWQTNNLVNYPDGNLYLGSNVLREWVAQGCRVVDSGAPIVELDFGSGTAGSHFDEACFDEEL